MPNSPLFSAARYIKRLFLKPKVYNTPPPPPILRKYHLAPDWMAQLSDIHVYAHIFAWMLFKPLYSHLLQAVGVGWGVTPYIGHSTDGHAK